DANDLPGPVLVTEPAQDRRPDRRLAVRHPRPEEGEVAGAGAARDGRIEPGALQPLPTRVLWRATPADRRRAGARAVAEADRVRRARLGARRLDPGAGPEPAPQPAARLPPHVRLHLP